MAHQPENPIEVFLGRDAAAGGPFAILGVKHEPRSDAEIRAASRRCLEQINRHPRSRTPAADEARLAVHTAATQLLDASLRTELARHWPEGKVSRPVAWSSKAANALNDRLRVQARTLIGASGGWNSRARKRLTHFARVNTLSAYELVGVLRDLAHDAPQDNTEPRPAPKRTHSRTTRADSTFSWMLASYAAMLVLLVSAVVLRWTPISGPDPETAALPSEQTNPPSAAPRASEPAAPRRHISALTHAVEQLLATQPLDRERASTTVAELTTRWAEYRADELRRVTPQLMELIARIDGPGRDAWITTTLTQDGRQRSIFADAVLQTAQGTAGDVLADALSQAFDRAATTLQDDPDRWSRWAIQLDAYGRIHADNAAQARRDAVTTRLSQPITDRPGWVRVAQRTAPRMNWRRGSPDRVWLLGLIQNPSIRSDRLSTFMEAMLTHSSAAGLRREMVPAPDASGDERSRVLDRLRSAWAVSTDNVDDPRVVILERVTLFDSITPESLDRSDAMGRTTELARLNAACRAWILGDQGVAAAALVEDAPSNPRNQQPARSLSSSRSDARDAELLRNENDPDELVSMLTTLRQRDDIGPWTAHSLVYVALRSPSSDARALAQAHLQSNADLPSVLTALDRLLVSERPSTRSITLVADVLNLDDPPMNEQGIRALRAALLARMHRSITQGTAPEFQRFETSLTQAYTAGQQEQTPTDAREAVLNARLALTLAPGADPASHQARRISTLHRVLSQRARGGLQQTLAEQITLVHATAHTVSSRHPTLTDAVEQLMARYATMLQRAPDTVRQMLVSELTMTRIWKLAIEAEMLS